jgi:amidase
MEYWNSTAQLTGTGRPVDAIISPLAPFAAARPEKYTYLTYSSYVNLLDYTSVVVPVTQVDKSIDKKDENFVAVDEVDQETQDTCKSSGLMYSWCTMELTTTQMTLTFTMART